MSAKRPTPRKSALTGGAAAVIAPAPAAPPPAPPTKASISGNAGKTGSAGGAGGRIVKVTARISEDLAGRCRAAFLDGVIDGGPTSFEGWVAEAMGEKLARAEKKKGRAYPPVGADRIPKGRRS